MLHVSVCGKKNTNVILKTVQIWSDEWKHSYFIMFLQIHKIHGYFNIIYHVSTCISNKQMGVLYVLYIKFHIYIPNTIFGVKIPNCWQLKINKTLTPKTDIPRLCEPGFFDKDLTGEPHAASFTDQESSLIWELGNSYQFPVKIRFRVKIGPLPSCNVDYFVNAWHSTILSDWNLTEIQLTHR